MAWTAGFGSTTAYAWDVGGNDCRLVARYEYAPYGKVIGPDDDDGDWRDDAGPYATENPIRFSTKYFDDETGLGYWGYRYYSPSLGRWISRDPIGVFGTGRLYVAFQNRPALWVDPDGLKATAPYVMSRPALPGPSSSTRSTSPPIDDRAHACCAYELARVQSSPGGSSRASRRTCWKTRECSTGATSPDECCRCAKSGGTREDHWVITPKKGWASWGECCFCTVTYTSMGWAESDGQPHAALIIDCPEGDGKPARAMTLEQDWPHDDPDFEDDWWGCGDSQVKVYSRAYHLTETHAEARIPCLDGHKLMDRICETYPNSCSRDKPNDRATYIWLLVQCRTFAWYWYTDATLQWKDTECPE